MQNVGDPVPAGRESHRHRVTEGGRGHLGAHQGRGDDVNSSTQDVAQFLSDAGYAQKFVSASGQQVHQEVDVAGVGGVPHPVSVVRR
ncbi:MAG: hypothetical protein WA991_08700 [Ornithinimicrobium sp.]